MRRPVINIVLSAVFILAAWILAVRFDFLSAENNAAIGRSYMVRASTAKAKASFLLEAESRYKTACRLNPYDTVNLLEFAVLEKELFLSAPAKYKDRLNSALDYFHKVSALDPKNYIIDYEIGRNCVELWQYLDDENKKYAVEKLKACLKLMPDYHDKVYQILLNNSKNHDLWKYRREIFDMIDAKNKRIAFGPEWSGKADDGVNIYKNGNMYWAGTASRTIEVPKGKALIKIKARGDESRGVWPYMIVELDGQEIGETFVDSAEWKEYGFKTDTNGGTKVLSVTFPNDGADKKEGTDRNLYVGDVEVERHE